MATDIARLRSELEQGRRAKQTRLTAEWMPNDLAYAGIVPIYSKMSYNFRIPVYCGWEDTLIAKIDDAPIIKFGSNQPGEVRIGRQLDSLWKEQSQKPDYDYAMADLQSKRHAARYGRAFLKVVGTKKPFCIDVLSIDPYDMVTDPNGGGDLEDHRYVIQDGIFRTKRQLLDGVKSGMYDKAAVVKLLAGPASSEDAYKTESQSFGRWTALEQSGYGYNSAGSTLYRICEHVTFDEEGVRHLVNWSPESGIVLKDGTLEERYGADLLPWVSWAPFVDNKVFWSKAPGDDIRQAAEAMRITIMEMMVNVQKKNAGIRVFDPARISAVDMAVNSPNGLVVAQAGAASLPGGLEGAFRIVQTPDVTSAMNVVQFLDQFTGQKTGVTPDTQGTSGEDVLGIYQGNLAQVADRMGLQSRYYRNAWRRIGTRFVYQVKRNLTGKVAVQDIGAKGSEMTYLLARNIDPTIGISISGGNAEAAVSEAKRKERGASLDALLANPATGAMFNIQQAAGERLKASGWEEDEVRLLLNKDAGSEYRDQQLRAEESIEKILEGDKPPIYYGATTVFVQTVLDGAKSFTDGAGPEHERLIAYASAHLPIAAKNSAIMAYEKATLAGIVPEPVMPDQPEQTMPMPGETPLNPVTPEPNVVPIVPGEAQNAPFQG
jgi:hypothetical protein